MLMKQILLTRARAARLRYDWSRGTSGSLNNGRGDCRGNSGRRRVVSGRGRLLIVDRLSRSVGGRIEPLAATTGANDQPFEDCQREKHALFIASKTFHTG